MKYTKIRIKEKFSIIHTCIQCSTKFLRIPQEENIGYIREKCPWCTNGYLTGNKTPPISHNFEPYALMKKHDKIKYKL